MGSWVWSPQARRLMFMTIPEKYKLCSLVLCSKIFEKLIRKKFRKTIFFEKFSLDFRTNFFFDPHFREKKSRKYQHFAIFSLSKMVVEKSFCSEIQWKFFEENIFSIFFLGPTFRNFWNRSPSSKVDIFRGWSWTSTCELVGTQLNFPCCAWNIPYLIE